MKDGITTGRKVAACLQTNEVLTGWRSIAVFATFVPTVVQCIATSVLCVTLVVGCRLSVCTF